jgi:hypothetical protein
VNILGVGTGPDAREVHDKSDGKEEGWLSLALARGRRWGVDWS